MWIRDVDVPAALVGAHERGELVIFVGAGASMGAPSRLPDFKSLAKAVAEDFNQPAPEDRLDRPDWFLGDLDDEDAFDVHAQVEARIDDPDSQPNDLHRAVVALAVTRPPVRIVTTNYDLHLSSVLEASDTKVVEYAAPALPVGDSFTGLVYLHGCIRRDPKQLVITDTDFGTAYLRDAWATRFLDRMFSKFTVLFIGYSHDDVVMSYLARGLGRDTSRFVLTDEPENHNWRRLRIVPVAYPNADKSYRALGEAVAAWGQWAASGMLDHRERVKDLVAFPPPQVPEQVSYLEAILSSPEKVGLFTEFASGDRWLTWAASHPEVRRLFEPAVPATDGTRVLSYWFAQQVLSDEACAAAGLAIHRAAGGKMRPEAWGALGHCLSTHSRPLPAWLMPWIIVMVQDDPGFHGAHPVEWFLAGASWPDERAISLLVFEHLSEPVARYQRVAGLEGRPRFEVAVRGDVHSLSQSWETAFRPHLGEVASDVIAIVDRHLRRAYWLARAAAAEDSRWDLPSAMRLAIEDSGEGLPKGPLDVVIRAARDTIEHLLVHDQELAASYLVAWASSEAPLLRRLALHGWVERTDVDATAKVRWLTETGWLYKAGLRHELFRLIEAALADADPGVANEFLSQTIAGPGADDSPDEPERRDYQVFTTLSWIAEQSPGLDGVRQARDEILSRCPQFEPHQASNLAPSFNWTEAPGPTPPMSAEELHLALESNAEGTVQDLLQHRAERTPLHFEFPSWGGVCAVVAEAVSTYPTDGFAILDASAGNPDLASPVIQGWRQAQLDDDTALRVLRRLCTLNLGPIVHEIVELLRDRSEAADAPATWTRSAAAFELAGLAWSAMDEDPIDSARDDWLGEAINDPAGKLAQFHINTIAADWRLAGDDWAGLPTPTKTRLEVLVNAGGHKAAMAQIVLAARLHFFDAADRTWCEAHVLPLLHWDDPERARRTWGGYLYWGRWTDHLLEAGLLRAYIDAAAYAASFSDELQDRLCEHLAHVALVSNIHPLESGWLTDFTSTADPAVRSNWMLNVGWTLEQLPHEDAAEQQWQRWMRPYWSNRVNGTPTQLTPEEVAAMATWIPNLTSSIDEAVRIAMQRPARVPEHSSFLPNLDKDKVNQAPEALARLVTHLLSGTPRPFYGCHSLKQVVVALKAQVPTAVDVKPIVDQALWLGCSDAPNW